MSKDLMITSVDYTEVESKEDERELEPLIHIHCRDIENELYHVEVKNFPPKFYALEADIENIFSLVDEYDEITNVEPGAKSLNGDSLVKIETELPRDVGKIRDDFEHYEADILFPNRFMIDLELRSGLSVPDDTIYGNSVRIEHPDLIEPVDFTEPDYREHHMDLEVWDKNGFPEDGEQPIICLTTWDGFRDEYILWVYESPDVGFEYPEKIPDRFETLDGRDTDEITVKTFETEEWMLDEYLDYIEETNPDLMTGWNFCDFDVPYLMDRLTKLGYSDKLHDLDKNRLSRLNKAYYRDGSWGGVVTKGRVVMDLMGAYKSTMFTELESYRLEFIGQRELDTSKTDYEGSIGDLWQTDPKKLYEYSVRDVELTVGIDEKQSVFEFWKVASQIAGCFIEEAPTANEIVDMYVLHKTSGRFVLPSKGVEDYEDYGGGAVFEPITGVANNVTVLDLKSLYPLCMSTMNLSPETYVEDPESFSGEMYRSPPVPARDGERLYFKKEPKGIISEIIDELLSERDELKQKRDEHEPGSELYAKFNRQQGSVKVVTNSLYGVLGWERFRLYDKDMGAAVTATGRGVINYTEEKLNDMGLEVTYGDTDSVMVELGKGVSKEEAMKRSFEMEETINNAYDEYAKTLNADTHRFEMEFEKLYRRFFQAGKKKRYAGHIIWKEGKDVDKTDITGFEYVRSSTPNFVQDVQKEVIDRIVRGDDENIKQYVHDKAHEVLDGEVPLDEIGIPGGIGKDLSDYDNDTVQVRGSKFANLLFELQLGNGSKPKRVYLDRVHDRFYSKIKRRREEELETSDTYIRFRRQFSTDTDPVICFEKGSQIPDEFQVDWDLQLEKTLKGPLERILEPMGISWDEAVSGAKQTGLGEW